MSDVLTCSRCNRLMIPVADSENQLCCSDCGAVLETPRDPVWGDEEVELGVGVASSEPMLIFEKGSDREEPDMDMTPMVDVTFLLLIFFMVTAAFTMQKSFEIPTPKDDTNAKSRSWEEFEEDPDYVVVRIDRYNTCHVLATNNAEEEEAPSQQDLLIKLREARDGSGATRMLVMAHGDSLHERVVMVMDAGTDVGMEDVKLVTVEEDGL